MDPNNVDINSIIQKARQKLADDPEDENLQILVDAYEQGTIRSFPDGAFVAHDLPDEPPIPGPWQDVIEHTVLPLIDALADICEQYNIPYVVLVQGEPVEEIWDGVLRREISHVITSLNCPPTANQAVRRITDLLAPQGGADQEGH